MVVMRIEKAIEWGSVVCAHEPEVVAVLDNISFSAISAGFVQRHSGENKEASLAEAGRSNFTIGHFVNCNHPKLRYSASCGEEPTKSMWPQLRRTLFALTTSRSPLDWCA
jgi:hypothetical protein